jgi:acyl-CoA reductase-like NAD-dependent aldehyde dehydrogenase
MDARRHACLSLRTGNSGWTCVDPNCYHAYPAHAAFGGYKQSGIGRETHKMMLDHYQQTKNLLVSYSQKPSGFL